jgi:hypothetical protein
LWDTGAQQDSAAHESEILARTGDHSTLKMLGATGHTAALNSILMGFDSETVNDKGKSLVVVVPNTSVTVAVRLGGMETGISESSKRVSIFSFATQGGKQVSFYFQQGNWVPAREAQIRFPAG